MGDFGGKNGKIDYADMSKKRDTMSSAGNDLSRKGNKTKTSGISTTDCGDKAGYSGTIKDETSREVADQSGWGR